MYFIKKATVSKAALFGALHSLFVIVLKLIFDTFPIQDKFFVVVVLIAYGLIFKGKYQISKARKEQAQVVVFKRRLSLFSQTGEIKATTKVKAHGKYFYESQSVTSQMSPLFRRFFTASGPIEFESTRLAKGYEDFNHANAIVNHSSKNNRYLLRKGDHSSDEEYEYYEDRVPINKYHNSRLTAELGGINLTVKESTPRHQFHLNLRLLSQDSVN
jgi:hypothetical protein